MCVLKVSILKKMKEMLHVHVISSLCQEMHLCNNSEPCPFLSPFEFAAWGGGVTLGGKETVHVHVNDVFTCHVN